MTVANDIQAVGGMHDLLPQHAPYWQRIEALLRQLAANYGYSELRTPLLEHTKLFKRAIGDVTDIVEKEMYTFNDRSGDSLSLRPEGTASCVRAGIEHGLLYNQLQRLWYMGPMFRHERPQKWRYRQFHQFGMEAFGMPGPEVDAEIILFTVRLWQHLGLQDSLCLQLNSLGELSARHAYRSALVAFLTAHQQHLDEDSQRRLHTNPLRILDSKNPDLQALLAQAPQLPDYLDPESAQHFAQLRHYLDVLEVPYVINTRLVRGLDYYNRTVFEWVLNDASGAQSTVCAGGRYDGLVAQFGGKTTPAVGFALGLERLLALLEGSAWQQQQNNVLDVYVVVMPDVAREQALANVEILRDHLPALRIQLDCSGATSKAQFKRADKSGAKCALIFTAAELAQQRVGVKYLRETGEQTVMEFTQCIEYLLDRSKQ